MKRIVFLLTILLTAGLFLSCGNKALTDDYGCYLNYEDALKSARKKNLPLLVLFTSDGDDNQSSQLVSQILKNEAFSSEILSAYTVFHADFSGDFFAKTNAGENPTPKQQESANFYTNLVQKNYQHAMLFSVDTMPALFLCTKDGFVISDLPEFENINNLQDFKNGLSFYKEELQAFEQKLAATKKGSAIDKIEAIDTVYNTADSQYRVFLLPLVEKVLKLDKTNKSGLLGKYILANADSSALYDYSRGDVEAAVQKYLSAANNQYVRAEEKQECFYTAAFLASYSGSQDYQGILSYLRTAYDLAPQSDKASSIQEAINYYELVVENQGSLNSQSLADE